ncbi:MAG: excalibur calcium-binding domain-containing protein [Anaerolineae bacterium]|nr:excalibur calcium-binding domain-containing protein [Anaerolineae bacterium]
MTSCEEAYACLNAGNRDLDRDGDGVPCESICPGG